MSPRKKNRKSAAAPAPDPAPAQDSAKDAAAGESLEEWRDRALRAHAEMQNMRKRLENEVEDRTRARMEALFHELILLHDHLELALEAVPAGLEQDPAAAPFTCGVRAIHGSFESLLRRFGLETIQPGPEQEFDPENHEAVQTVERPDLARPRLELVRRGYRMGRRILRPAQVRLLRPLAVNTD